MEVTQNIDGQNAIPVLEADNQEFFSDKIQSDSTSPKSFLTLTSDIDTLEQKQTKNSEPNSSWFDLFAELDPLENKNENMFLKNSEST